MTAASSWGAGPADWLHFANTLGLRIDLLPVVSNPGAVISPQSKMQGLGKTPSRYNGQRHVVGVPQWTQHSATNRDIEACMAEPDLGICVQTRRVRALDLDIADPAACRRVEDLITLTLGQLPARRRANSGKCLLMFNMPGEFAKRVIQTADGAIEFLAGGQQFVAVGTHPSGARYEWDGGLPGQPPAVTPDEFEALWQALVEEFALPGGEGRSRAGVAPTMPRRMADLNDPTVTWLDANGWVTGYERDGRVDVRCPWQDEHTGDSGPTATSWFPAGVGGFARGHFKCLHAHCSSRTDGDFLEAVGCVADDFDIVETVAIAQADGSLAVPAAPPAFLRDKTGDILATLNNVLSALRRPDLCGWRIGFDLFLDTLMVAEGDAAAWRPLADQDYTSIRSALETRRFKPISSELCKESVRLIAHEQRFDSAKDWAATLRWDGVPRVDTFFPTFFGTEDTPYTRAVGRYTWSALAGRCVEPGAKADMVPVLIGLQGAGKTSVVEVLAPTPEAFVEINLEKKDDDLARSLRGKLVGEIAELRGLQSRDAEAIKAWVSRRTEEWTPKYREFATRFHRRLLLIGTGNRDEFLDDETGERRWLPMVVGAVDAAAVRAVRDQLWAEGLTMFEAAGREVLWRDAFELAKAEHGKFKVSDSWLEPIREWLDREDMEGPRADQPIRLVDVMTSALGFNVQKITRKDELRAAKVMRMLPMYKGNRRINGVVVKVWLRAENCTENERAENCALAELA